VEKGCKMIGDAKTIKFERNGRIVMMAVIRDGVFVLSIEMHNSESCRPGQVEVRAGSLRDWHERFGHVHVDAIRKMANIGAVEGVKIDSDEENFFCEPCVVAKQCRPSYQKNERRRNPETDKFVHTDFCNGFETRSLSDALYFILFKDDTTGYRTVEFLSCKSEIQKTNVNKEIREES